MSERIDVFHHFELQNLATHYKTLNWALHTIFIPMHITIIGTIAAVADHDGAAPDKAGAGEYAHIFGFIGCFAGLWLIGAWVRISDRHGYTVTAIYKRLHALEAYMKEKYAENVQGFDVHLLVDLIDRSDASRSRMTTKRILETLRWLMRIAYVFLAIILASELSEPFQAWFSENFLMRI